MHSSGNHLSRALSTELPVRNAYDRTKRRHLWRQRWRAATIGQRMVFVLGCAWIAWVAVASAITQALGMHVGWIMIPGILSAALATVAAERRAFGDYFRAHRIDSRPRRGEFEKLRYLVFVDGLKSHGEVSATDLAALIPAMAARIGFRGHVLRRHPVAALHSALIAILIAAMLAQPPVWQTGLGPQLLVFASLLWLLTLILGPYWRELRPNAEARERELLAFLHMAVMDLAERQEGQSSHETSENRRPFGRSVSAFLESL